MLYLLQLVQALKFEPPPPSQSTSATSRNSSRHDRSALSNKIPGLPPLQTLEEFLIERAVKDSILGNNFHWYLMVEIEDKAVGKMYGKVAYRFMTKIAEVRQECTCFGLWLPYTLRFR